MSRSARRKKVKKKVSKKVTKRGSKKPPIMVAMPPQLYNSLISAVGSMPYMQVADILDAAKGQAVFARVEKSQVIQNPEELKELMPDADTSS